MLVVLRKGVY